MGVCVVQSAVDGGGATGSSGGCSADDDTAVDVVAVTVTVTAGVAVVVTAKAPRPLAAARRHIRAVARIGADESPSAICKQTTKQA